MLDPYNMSCIFKSETGSIPVSGFHNLFLDLTKSLIFFCRHVTLIKEQEKAWLIITLSPLMLLGQHSHNDAKGNSRNKQVLSYRVAYTQFMHTNFNMSKSFSVKHP